MSAARAVVIGGGLAGMTVAKELLKRGLHVVLLDAAARLGGKTGADRVGGCYVEHGFHVFPKWYLHTRKLLRELNVDRHLIDIDRVHHLQKGRFPKFVTYYPPTSLRRAWHNIADGLLPWHESIALLYGTVDLASQPFRRRAFLDRISVSGFLRSRFYRCEGVARFQQHTLLQAQSIPVYELSAMTMQNVLRCWTRCPSPIFSMLDGNLQERFIWPFEAHLRALGADIHLGRRVTKLQVSGGRVAAAEYQDSVSGARGTLQGDIFVLAVPPECVCAFIDADVCRAEQLVAQEDKDLSEVTHLRSAPMAGMQLYLKRRIAGVPKEHVDLYQSRYGLSMIDVSQHWDGLENTTLCVIASNFAPLARLSPGAMEKYLIQELAAYVPFDAKDIDQCHIRPNVQVPLFLNTIGSWQFRPATRAAPANLFVTGDYCRTDADAATMESAVMSGLATARDILADRGMKVDVGLEPLKSYPRGLLALAKYAGLPVMAPIGLCYWVQRRLTAS